MIQNPKWSIILCLCTVLAAALPSAAAAGTAAAVPWRHRSQADPFYGDSLAGGHSDLPPGWLMNRTDPTGATVPAVRDPEVAFDPTIGRIRESYTQGGVEMRPPMVADLDQYSTLLTTRTVRRLWRGDSRESRSMTRGTVKKPQGLFHVDLPIQLPKFTRGFLGDAQPNIDVSGS